MQLPSSKHRVGRARHAVMQSFPGLLILKSKDSPNFIFSLINDFFLFNERFCIWWMTCFGIWALELQNTPRMWLFLIVLIAIIVLVFITSGQNWQANPWKYNVVHSVKKREDIANRICNLGASYNQILRNCWVRYFEQNKNSSSNQNN